MTAYPVTAVANNLSGIYSQPYMIRNSGSNPVYLGQDSSLSPSTRSITLDAGAALMWSGETELWAVTDPGVTSEVELLFTGTGSFIPGPSTVSVSARVEQIYSKPIQAITNLTSVIYDSSGLDISEYASIVIALNTPGLMSGVDTSRLIQVQVIQYDSAGNQVWIEAPMFYGSGLLNYTTQVRGASFQITATYVGGATTGNISVQISGSQIDQGHKYYQQPGSSGLFVNCTDGGSQPKPTSKIVDMQANVAASANALVYLPTIAGIAYIQYHNGTTANQRQQMNGPGSIGYSLSTPLLTATAADYIPPSMIPTPEVPLVWNIFNGSAAGTARVLISWE